MFAVLLLFDKKDDDYLSSIIKELCKRYKSEIFVPHITVYDLVHIDLKTMENIVLKNTHGVKPFFVEKFKVNHSDDFWKTLFIDIKQNEFLTQINKKLTTDLAKFSGYEFRPHVSLIYKNMNEQKRKHLAETLDIKDRFLVSKIGILQFSEDIPAWKIVKKYRFV